MAEIPARAERPLEEPADHLEASMGKPGVGTGPLARSSSAVRPSWPAARVSLRIIFGSFVGLAREPDSPGRIVLAARVLNPA